MSFLRRRAAVVPFPPKTLFAPGASPTDDELLTRFTYHPPTPDQVDVYEHVRFTALEFARWLADVVPPGREQALALTHLETAVMFANAGIARRGEPDRPGTSLRSPAPGPETVAAAPEPPLGASVPVAD